MTFRKMTSSQTIEEWIRTEVLAKASSYGKFVVSRAAETYEVSKSGTPVGYATAVIDGRKAWRKATVVLVVANLEKAGRVC
jgi:hypothetical protein